MKMSELLLTVKYEIYKYEKINNLTPTTIVISKDYLSVMDRYYARLFGLEVVPTTVKNFIMVGEKVEKN